MITIVVKRTNQFIITHTVSENATLGTYGSHQLLLQEYRKLDEGYDSDWHQMLFNYKWLKDKQLDYGPLWCVYCGKEELRIYHWTEKHNYSDMATADHFIPKSEAPHLARDRRNLRVACHTCNQKKGTKYWEEKFPYD